MLALLDAGCRFSGFPHQRHACVGTDKPSIHGLSRFSFWPWYGLGCYRCYLSCSIFLLVVTLWCGHLCPVGAFYSLVGKFSILRISAPNRENCDDCMDCFAVCPEHQVIRPALKGADNWYWPCLFWTRNAQTALVVSMFVRKGCICILLNRFNNQSPEMVGPGKHQEVSP